MNCGDLIGSEAGTKNCYFSILHFKMGERLFAADSYCFMKQINYLAKQNEILELQQISK